MLTQFTNRVIAAIHLPPPFFLKDKVLFIPSWPLTPYVAKNDLKVLIFLLQPPEPGLQMCSLHLLATNLITPMCLFQHTIPPTTMTRRLRASHSLAEVCPTRSNGMSALPTPTSHSEAAARWPQLCCICVLVGSPLTSSLEGSSREPYVPES